MNLNPADNADVHERYMAGTVNGDMDILAALILEIIREVEATSSNSVQWRPMKAGKKIGRIVGMAKTQNL